VYPGDASIPVNTVSYQYDVMGNLKKQQNSVGMVDLYTYNNQGRILTKVQEKQDGTEAITASTRYDQNGNKHFETDGNGVTKENTYDELNRLKTTKITVTDINNNQTIQTTSYDYDANGNQLAQTDWRGNSFTNTYDPLNRLTEKKDPYNKTIQRLEYNHNNSQVKSYDALNNLTQYTYDKNNRLLSTLDPGEHTTSQTYDNVGNIITKTDGTNNVTTNCYDEFNRLTSVKNAKIETTSYAYDLNGNILTQTDAQGNITTFEYNVLNKPLHKIDHGGRTGTPGQYIYEPAKTASYTYYADGNLFTNLNRSGLTTTYTYDIHSRMNSQAVGSIQISYTYDDNGNQLTITDSIGTTTRTYDELNRVKSKITPVVGASAYLYDLITGLEAGFTAEQTTDPQGNSVIKVYDKAGRLKEVRADGGTTTYEYYDNGSRQSVVYPDSSREDYTYNNDGLLSNLVNKKADNTIIDAYTYTYDAAHNQTSKVDSRGTTSYSYDELNRLKTVTEPNSTVTTYTFDAAGNRATEMITGGSGTRETAYVYNTQIDLPEQPRS
ncbi:MAG: RHS repeat domain-containing protein, partial [Desulfitobacteriaceae bacterium]